MQQLHLRSPFNIIIGPHSVTIGELKMNLNRPYGIYFYCGEQRNYKSATVMFKEGVTAQEVVLEMAGLKDIKCPASCAACHKRLLGVEPLYNY